MSPQEETASLAQHQFFKCGESVRNIKDVVTCVTLGDERVGKTSLVISYISNGFPSDYIPTAFDKYSVLITINSEPYTLQINDTAGQSDFDIFRAFCYPNVDVFLLCFSVVNPASIKNIKSKWLKEIRDSNALVPIVLVGTQQDLRNDVKVLLELAKHGQRPITEEECKTLAKDIGAVGYMECSALTQKNLKETFDYIVAVGLKYIESGRPSKDSGVDFRFSRFSIKRSSIPSVRIVQKNVLKFQSSCPKPWWRRTFCCCV